MLRLFLLLSLVALITANAQDHTQDPVSHDSEHLVDQSIKQSIDQLIQSIDQSTDAHQSVESVQLNNQSWVFDDLHPKTAPSRLTCRELTNHIHAVIEDGHENIDQSINQHRDLRLVILIDQSINQLPAIDRVDVELSFKPQSFDTHQSIKQSIKVHSSVDADDSLHNLLRARMVYRMLPHRLSIDDSGESINQSVDQPINVRFDKLISFLPSFHVEDARVKFSLHGDSFECRTNQRLLVLDAKYGAAWSNQSINQSSHRHADHVQQTRSSLSSLFNVIGSMLSINEETQSIDPSTDLSSDSINQSINQPVKSLNTLPYDLGDHEILIDQSIACSNLSLSYTARYINHSLILSLMTSSISPIIEKIEVIIVPPSVRIHGVSKPFLMQLIDSSHQSIYQLTYPLPPSLWWQPKSRFHYDFRVKLLHESLVCRFAGRGTGTHDASSSAWQSERIGHQLHQSSNQSCPWKDSLTITASPISASYSDHWKVELTSNHVLDWSQIHVFLPPNQSINQSKSHESMVYMQQTQFTSEQLAALPPRSRAIEKDKQSKTWFRTLTVPTSINQLIEMRFTVSYQGVPCDTKAKIGKMEQFAVSWNLESEKDAVTSWIIMPITAKRNDQPIIHHTSSQSINQPINHEPVNHEPVNQPIKSNNQPINQPTNQPINEIDDVSHPPIDHPHHPSHHPHYQHDELIDQMRHVEIDPFQAANQFAALKYATNIHPSIDQSTNQPIHTHHPHVADLHYSESYQSINHPESYQSINHPESHQSINHPESYQSINDPHQHYINENLDVHPGHQHSDHCDFWCQISGVCQGCLARTSFDQPIPPVSTCSSCISVLQCQDDPCRIEKACDLCHALPQQQRPEFCQQVHC